VVQKSLREMHQARDGDRQRAGNAEKALEEMKLEMRSLMAAVHQIQQDTHA
jgi:hypothetical protein